MYNSKLFNLLSVLSPEEWKETSRFISIYGSEKSDVVVLYRYIYQYRKDLTHKNLVADDVHQKLYPKLTAKSFRNVMSKLQKSIEEYLVWKRVTTYKDIYQLQLFEAYDDRGLNDQANKIADKVRKEVANNESVSIEKHATLHRINHAQYFSSNPIKYTQGKEILIEALRSLHILQQAWANQYEVELKSMSKIKNEDWIGAWQQVKDSRIESPETRVTQLWHELKDHNNPEVYDLLMNVLTKENLSNEMGQITLGYMNHYLVSENHKGSQESYIKRLNLIEMGLQKGFFLDKGNIDLPRFINTIQFAAAIKEISWAQTFYDDWKDKLSKDDYHVGEYLGRITLNFYAADYASCIRDIMIMKSNNPVWNIKIKTYSLLCYYELNRVDINFLSTQAQNVKVYLKKHKSSLGKNLYNANENFLTAYLLMIKDIDEAKAFIIAGNRVVEGKWLKEKLEISK